MQLHEQLNGGCDTSSEALRILQMEFRHSRTHPHVERVYVYANFNSCTCYPSIHPSIYPYTQTLILTVRSTHTQYTVVDIVVVKLKELTFGEEEKN